MEFFDKNSLKYHFISVFSIKKIQQKIETYTINSYILELSINYTCKV